MEYTCNAAVRPIRLRKMSQIDGNCFPQQGQPVSGQAVWKQQLFINGARAAGAGSGQARVTTQALACIAIFHISTSFPTFLAVSQILKPFSTYIRHFPQI